jgi:hypothetical protein
MNLDDSERVVGKQEVTDYFLFARHSRTTPTGTGSSGQ